MMTRDLHELNICDFLTTDLLNKIFFFFFRITLIVDLVVNFFTLSLLKDICFNYINSLSLQGLHSGAYWILFP